MGISLEPSVVAEVEVVEEVVDVGDVEVTPPSSVELPVLEGDSVVVEVVVGAMEVEGSVEVV